ncbi:MAG: UPF0262 family protein [Pseudomonadota bacterium]
MSDQPKPDLPRDRIVGLTLDSASIRRSNANIHHEREVAIYDILEENSFRLEGYDRGPYHLKLSIAEDRLHFSIADTDKQPLTTHMFSLSPFRRVIKDYFLVCESYYDAIRTAPPSRIQSIDMGRRGLHDEGSRLLCERLEGKIAIDHDTSRRLFTLICALHWKG